MSEQNPQPSEELTPNDLDTALVVLVIRDDGTSRLWLGDRLLDPEAAATLLDAAASWLRSDEGAAAYATQHD